MGFLKRILGGAPEPESVPNRPPALGFPPPVAQSAARTESERPAWMQQGTSATLYQGTETLEVVGESYRQYELWRVVGRKPTSDRVTHEGVAILVAETDNEYDENAIAVWMSGFKVGYLAREYAALYRPGLEKLAASGPVALAATVVGGGYDRSVAILGVFLDHDPTDFGLVSQRNLGDGLGEAFQTDQRDDSYDLSWMSRLPEDTRRAVAMLRDLLKSEPDAIDRHYMFAQLEGRLYRLRDAEATALDEYDSACVQHDSEMAQIRPALHAKFGALPLLDTYRQQGIRQQKAKNFERGLWWAERGLDLYGQDAWSADWTDDLRKRANTFRAKLEPKRATPTAGTIVPIDVATEVE